MTAGSAPRQLCVPVQKNAQAIPADVLDILRWLDLEKFIVSPAVAIAPITVDLSHLNPLFAAQPPIPVTLDRASSLMVPVAKNGAMPPLP